MPIITVKAIKGVVLTSDEQKRELLQKMTDAFIGVVGEVARPYTYCLIEETPLYEWSIAGRALPDLPFLYGSDYAAMHQRANALMREYVEQMHPPQPPSPNGSAATVSESEWASRADSVWRGVEESMQVDNGTLQQNKTLIRRLYDEINRGNDAILDELLTPDFVSHGGYAFPIMVGVRGVKEVVASVRSALPDLTFTVNQLVAERDRVVARGTVRGTHTGAPLFGAPPSGKQVTWTGIAIWRVSNGKLAERWFTDDDLKLMQGIGLIPAQGQN